MTHKNPFFSLKDFEKFHIKIEGINQTSQIPIPANPPIQLLEIYDDGFLAELPPSCCALGHLLSLDITLKNKMSVTTHVEEIEGRPKTPLRALLRFRRFDQKEWLELLSEIAGKQLNINEVIRVTRR